MSLKISNFSVTKSNSFAELSPKGLYIYNSPSELIKFGTGSAEIKTPSLRVTDLVVTGNLYVYGEQILSGIVVEIFGTSSSNFTIGNANTSGNTSLTFGDYAVANTLTSDGTNLTSSIPLIASDFKKNGNSLFSTITAELFSVPVGGIEKDIPIVLPNGKTYINDSNTLLVFLDGRLQINGNSDDYYEVGTTQIAFTYDLAEGAKILFLIIG